MGKRRDSRERIEREIVEVGRRHLVTDGAAGLSLRAIARDLGMVSSAVYRYVASRDDLLTLLLLDAYTELADEVDAAADGAGEDWRARLRAIGCATRGWAVREPARWALLYGSPVPGYHAPAERTVGPGTRVVAALLRAVDAGIVAGDIPAVPTALPEPTPRDFDGVRAEFGFRGDDGILLRGLALWAGLVGAISLEVFGQYGADTLRDVPTVFDAQLTLLIGLLTAPD
jgi:AcrR family transcriptional regulator